MTDFNHTETYLQNDGWFHIEVHWTTPGGEKRKAPMEGTGLGSCLLYTSPSPRDS